jgi:hypothetical protein
MTSYQVDTIYYNDQGEIVFNNSDVQGENENTTVDLSNYVEKKGDVMLGALTVPQLNFVSDGSSQQTAFTDELKQNVISNTVKTSEMTFSDNITYFWKPVQMEAELILSDGSVLVGTEYNSATTQISYDGPLQRTRIAQNTLIDNLTCGNINTAHLTSTTSNLQTQINTLQTQITAGIGSIFSEVSPTFEFTETGTRVMSYKIPKGIYIVTTLLQIWQKDIVTSSQWTTADYATLKINKTTNANNAITVYPVSTKGTDYRFPRTGANSKGAANLIQFDLGSIHITQPSSNTSFTNNQVLQLEYTLVMSNYTSIQPASLDIDPLEPGILAPGVSSRPEGVLIASFMRIGNL